MRAWLVCWSPYDADSGTWLRPLAYLELLRWRFARWIYECYWKSRHHHWPDHAATSLRAWIVAADLTRKWRT